MDNCSVRKKICLWNRIRMPEIMQLRQKLRFATEVSFTTAVLKRGLPRSVSDTETVPVSSASISYCWLKRLCAWMILNKNLAIANRSRVSCAHNTLMAFILHRDLEIYVKDHSRSLETEPLDRSYTTYNSKSSYLTLNIIVTLKRGSEVTQGHWN